MHDETRHEKQMRKVNDTLRTPTERCRPTRNSERPLLSAGINTDMPDSKQCTSGVWWARPGYTKLLEYIVGKA